MSNLETHKTRVKVQITTIKVVDEQTDEIRKIDAHGKLTVSECKLIANNSNCVFISKETNTSEYDVLTSDLLNIIK